MSWGCVSTVLQKIVSLCHFATKEAQKVRLTDCGERLLQVRYEFSVCTLDIDMKPSHQSITGPDGTLT